MGVVAVLCVEEKHIFNLIRTQLKRQGWVVFQAKDAYEALEHVRKEAASFLIFDRQAILPFTPEQMSVEISKDPGEGVVGMIDLEAKSPPPPTIFRNPKGPRPPAVAVRPLDWIGRTLRL